MPGIQTYQCTSHTPEKEDQKTWKLRSVSWITENIFMQYQYCCIYSFSQLKQQYKCRIIAIGLHLWCLTHPVYWVLTAATAACSGHWPLWLPPRTTSLGNHFQDLKGLPYRKTGPLGALYLNLKTKEFISIFCIAKIERDQNIL